MRELGKDGGVRDERVECVEEMVSFGVGEAAHGQDRGAMSVVVEGGEGGLE